MAINRGLRIDAQRLGVGADVADGEGPRRQLVELHLLDGLQVGAAHAGGVGDGFKAQLAEFADRLQSLANIGAGLQRGCIALVGGGTTRPIRLNLQIGDPASIQRHSYTCP
jgi:hypothetical protein